METLNLLGTVLGIGMLSGIRLYATVLLTGLALRFELLDLPAKLSGLELLAEPSILWIAGALFTVEFLSDKIAWLDSVWDTIHTFIRPLGAVALAWIGLSEISPVNETILAMACGGVALSSHAAKAGTRATINQSPEPASNILMSLFEDISVAALYWLAFSHPIIMLVIVVTFLAISAYLLPKLYRVIRLQITCLKSVLHFWSKPPTTVLISDKISNTLSKSNIAIANGKNALPCFTTKGFPWGRYFKGYLVKTESGIFFVGKRRFRWKCERLLDGEKSRLEIKSRLIFNRLILQTDDNSFGFIFDKKWKVVAGEFGRTG